MSTDSTDDAGTAAGGPADNEGIPGWSKAETIMVSPPAEEGSLGRRNRRVMEGSYAAQSGPVAPPAEPAAPSPAEEPTAD